MQLQGVEFLCIWDPLGKDIISKTKSVLHSFYVISASDSAWESEKTEEVLPK